MSLKLAVITVSTRPGRVGPAIADWFVSQARAEGGFEVVPVDLAEIALPLLQGVVEVPPRLFAGLSFVATAGAFVARLVAQESVSGGNDGE